MKWMKKLAAGVLAAGMVLTLLTACGGGGGASVSNGVVVEPAGEMTPVERNSSKTISVFQYNDYTSLKGILLKVKDVSNGENDLVAYNINGYSIYVGTEKAGYLSARYQQNALKIDHENQTSETADSIPARLEQLERVLMRGGYITKVEGGKMKVNGVEYDAEICTGEELGATYTFFYQGQSASQPSYIIIENDEIGKAVFKVESYGRTAYEDGELYTEIKALTTVPGADS